MAKRMIHYKSAEWYRIKFLRSIVIAIIVLLLTIMPMGLMFRQNHSVVMIIICGCVIVFLIGFFFISCKANHVAWKEVQAEEFAKRKKVHRRAPIKK